MDSIKQAALKSESVRDYMHMYHFILTPLQGFVRNSLCNTANNKGKASVKVINLCNPS